MKRQYAVCTTALKSADSSIQLLPAGEFSARDGRPGPGKKWRIDARSAAAVIRKAAARENPLVIDYEHQTLQAVKNGQPAPAAGWFTGLEWIEGAGLFTTDTAWTEKASAMIAAGEYKFISPVFSHGPDGTVTELHMAALTNDPGLDGMQALAAARFEEQEEESMDIELLKLLGLPEDADAEAVRNAVTALKQKNTVNAEGIEALKQKNKAQEETIALLKNASPDPEKFVPVEALKQIQTELAELKNGVQKQGVEALVQEGLKDGRILPATEAWARDLGEKNIESLKTFLASASPIAALKDTQTGGKAPEGEGEGEKKLTEDELAVCKRMGIDPESYQKTAAA